MNRMILGAALALVLVGIGLFWWQGRAEIEAGAPPPHIPKIAKSDGTLPTADISGLRGPEPPKADELTQEQRRFFRYDRNRDMRISRNEMLATRVEAFRKLDVDGNNLLTFEEWAVATVNKFNAADKNGDLELTPEEFATTRPKPSKKPACKC
jgi:hypothetical protein